MLQQFEPAVMQLGIYSVIASSWMNDSEQLVLDNIPNATSTNIGNSKHPAAASKIIESKDIEDIEGLISMVLTYNQLIPNRQHY